MAWIPDSYELSSINAQSRVCSAQLRLVYSVAHLISRRQAVSITTVMLHRLGGCEGGGGRRQGLGKGRDGRRRPVMAARTGTSMTTWVGGATELAAGWACTPVTPASNILLV